MQLLPNLSAAQLDITKLQDYCLSSEHPRGRHKARQFASGLGISVHDADWVRGAILQGITESEAIAQEVDEFGQRWRVDVLLTRQNRHAVVRTIWMVRRGETFARFITCWIL